METKLLILVFWCCLPGFLLKAQEPLTDSIPIAKSQTYKVSKDSLDAPVNYIAQDSMIYDIENKRIYLYGQAEVSYTTIHLKADYIIFDWESNTVTAEGLPDSLGNMAGHPEFSDGGESFNAKRMRYNFITRKGIIYEAVSKQNDVYVRSEVGKFIARNPQADTTRSDDVIYSKNAIFTSCDHEMPHYGIRSNKQKVVPNKTVVVGPSNLEIGGVPTPLYLPFGFFPITKTARAGLIFPRDYEYDPRYGFGLSNVGIFTPLGPYLNLELTGDIYFKQRWGLHLNTQYKKRYKFSGGFAVNYGVLPEEVEGVINKRKPFSVIWNHTQDPAAHPTISFNGNVRIQTENYDRAFQNDFESVTNNTLNSGLNFGYRPTGKPWNFTASMDHSQNNISRQVTISLPNLNFQTQRVYPFKRKLAAGKEKWFEKFGVTYRANARNRYQDTDTTLFQGDWLQRMEYGAQHSLNGDITFNVLKFFRISPNVQYGETYYFKQIDKQFDPNTIIRAVDTIVNPLDSTLFDVVYDTTFGFQTVDTLDVFKPYRDLRASVTMNFDLFGTMLFKKGWLRGLRHYAKPSISLNYSPDYTNPDLGYLGLVDTDNRMEFNEVEEYNRFLGGVYPRPSLREKQMSIGYGLNNIFQGKYFSKRDSTIKYFKMVDEFSINGSYNFVAEEQKWSQVSVRLRGNWFKNFLNIVIAARFDPYIVDENGRRTNTLAWDKYRRPLEFVQASLPIANTLTVQKIRGWFGKGSGNNDAAGDRNNAGAPGQADDFWSLIDNFSISHNIVFDLSRIDGRDTFRITTNSLRLTGKLQITKGWRISIDNISYDFKSKNLVYPAFSFYRDLHCWEMGLGWQPARGTYSFFLHVKPGTLGFIEVPYQRRNLGANFGGF